MSAGIQTTQGGTLIDRALALLGSAPADSESVAVQVMGIQRAPAVVLERMTTALLGADPRIRRLPDGRWDLVRDIAASPLIEESTFAVVDLETTGSRAGGGDRITEVAIYLLHRGEVTKVMDTLVNPERAIPPIVTRLTNISQRDVENQPIFEEIVDDVISAIAGRVFVAHNVRFDWNFLSRSVRRVRQVELDGTLVCTVRLAKRLIPGLRSRSLDSVSDYFGIEIEGRHRAAGDALATARVLRHLLDRAAEQGATTIRHLEQMCARRPRPRKKKKRRSMPQSMGEA